MRSYDERKLPGVRWNGIEWQRDPDGVEVLFGTVQFQIEASSGGDGGPSLVATVGVEHDSSLDFAQARQRVIEAALSLARKIAAVQPDEAIEFLDRPLTDFEADLRKNVGDNS